jgi:TonB family protein
MRHRPATLGLALLLGAAMAMPIPQRAHAQHFPGSMVQVGSWTLFASAAARTFSRCTVRRVQADGFAIHVGLTPGGVQLFGASAPRWEMKPRQRYPTSLTVDGRQFTSTGMATSADALDIDAAPEFFAALQSARQISVAANQRHFTMHMEGFEAASARLSDCVKEYAGRVLSAAATQPMPPAPRAAGAPSRPSPFATAGGTPIIIRVTPRPTYPDASRLAGEEGTVMIKVTFDFEGTPQLISVERSSGFPALDQAATDAVREMRIEPYTKDGKPESAVIVVPMRFTLAN